MSAVYVLWALIVVILSGFLAVHRRCSFTTAVYLINAYLVVVKRMQKGRCRN